MPKHLSRYAKGYELAIAANNQPQSYYHEINRAFLEFVFPEIASSHASGRRKRLKFAASVSETRMPMSGLRRRSEKRTHSWKARARF